MSEQLININDAEERFSRFILGHIGVALRWEIMDARPLMPFDFVVFSREGDETASDDLAGLAPYSYYGMEIFMKRSAAERKEDEKTIPSVYIDLQPGDLEILDPYLRLSDVVPDYDPAEPYSYACTANDLLDKLEALESRKLFVAAGRRMFPGSPDY